MWGAGQFQFVHGFQDVVALGAGEGSADSLSTCSLVSCSSVSVRQGFAGVLFTLVQQLLGGGLDDRRADTSSLKTEANPSAFVLTWSSVRPYQLDFDLLAGIRTQFDIDLQNAIGIEEKVDNLQKKGNSRNAGEDEFTQFGAASPSRARPGKRRFSGSRLSTLVAYWRSALGGDFELVRNDRVQQAAAQRF
jgi:hypothetical protein